MPTPFGAEKPGDRPGPDAEAHIVNGDRCTEALCDGSISIEASGSTPRQAGMLVYGFLAFGGAVLFTRRTDGSTR